MPAPLFLVGFMAAGKTSVGRALAAEAGRRFVDLDDEIAAMGEPPEGIGSPGSSLASVAVLVARDEAEFRRREAAALAQVIAGAGDGPIVATGGGAASFGDNLERMRAAGLVIALGVDVAEARARAARSGGDRPLLATAEGLAVARAATYRRAHAVVSTDGRTLVEVAREVAAVERAWTALPAALRTATLVALGARTYPIAVADDFALGDSLAGATRIAVISDRTVAAAWGSAARAAVPGAIELAIDPGEASKSLATYERLAGALIAQGLDRGSVIVALGGGVVGDLAGFIAATLFRGIPVVQLPTTIVAMTDAAIGGKTAVDLPAGKNLVGAFHQPRLVACALKTLATLPVRERRAGFGELWKYALLDGPALWRAVDACTPWANTEASELRGELRDVIDRAAAYKAAVVGRDELERTGHRALLNLGHTVGHAIEARDGLLHGEAVGLGLIAACRVSAVLGLATSALEREVVEALRRTGLPVDLDGHLRPEVLDYIRVDKKRSGDRVRFIAPREVGACEPVEIAIADLGRILRAGTAP